MRSCATLSKFYERYMVEEGVDLVKELYSVESKKGAQTHDGMCLRFQEELPAVIESKLAHQNVGMVI